MGNKNKQVKKQPPIVNKPKAVAAPEKNKTLTKRNVIFILIAIALTAVVYSMSIKNSWIKNWDDGGYVTEHDATSTLSASNLYKLTSHDISRIFTTFYKGNYHPLTTLVYAVEYNIFKDNAKPYHFINLLFHLLNVLLVFLFLKKITKRPEIAFIAALLFGIHPMHVESVAWVSELKDVMYTFFFLLSVLYYMKSSEKKENKIKSYIISLIFFILSCLSKSAAVTLPAILVLLDLYIRKKWNGNMANNPKPLVAFIGRVIQSSAQKIPFFIVAFVFGIVAVFSQKSAGAIQDLNPLFAIWERPMLAGYATMMYLMKLFVPIDLSAMYPYPDRINGHLPVIFYIAPVVVLAVVLLINYSRKFNKEILFGSMFFLITIILVLQLLPVGGAILAERYTYVPYIGLFMIIGKGYVFSQEDQSKIARSIKMIYPAVLFFGIAILSAMSFQRIQDWENGEILFTDVIKKYPNLPFAYNNRGYLYFSFLKDNNKALADYTKCIQLDSTFHRAYSNRGVLYYNFYGPNKSDSAHLKLALQDFTNALKYSSDNTDALIGRANTYSSMRKFELSIPDYNKYITLETTNAKAYLWRGIALYNTGKYNEAFPDFNKCIELTSDNDNAFLWRGLIYFQQKNYSSAVKDFDQSLLLNANQSEAFSWRGLAEYNLKIYDKALNDYTSALNLNPKDAATYINRSTIYYEQKNYDLAFKDYCSAGDLGYALNKDYFFKLKALAGK
jgi:tetratricopeptide (TPR) repeat protein